MATKLVEYDGKTQSVYAWAKEYGVPRKTLEARLKRGVPMADALKKYPTNEQHRQAGAGRQIREGVLSILLQLIKDNPEECRRQLLEAYKTDVIKLLKDIACLLPKDAPERAATNVIANQAYLLTDQSDVNTDDWEVA